MGDDSMLAVVNFELVPSQYVITKPVNVERSLQYIVDELELRTEVPREHLVLTYNGRTLAPTQTLNDLRIVCKETVSIIVESNDMNSYPIRIPPKQISVPHVMTVRVCRERGDVEDIEVSVHQCQRRKPYLGGYVHKLTGVKYLNASAQTNPKSPQMTVPYCYMSVFEDKIMMAEPYFTADQFLERRLKAIIVMQRYWRRWLACRLCDRLRAARDRRLEWERAEELRKRKEKEDSIKRDFERRIHPKSKEDFDLVYAALEKWRVEELANINAEIMDEATRKAALCALLDQESQLIASIGKHKIEAGKNIRTEGVQKLLEKAAAPKRWKAYDGRYTQMDTQFTIRAKEMRDIYNSITMQYLTQDERLDVLLTLKHTVKEHDCKLTREIIELIDREADLIMRGVSNTNLEGLRQRIATLFLEYCKNPMFNPEIARHLKVPQDPSLLKQNIYFCTGANEYLPSTEFKIRAKTKSIGKSRKATETDNIANARQNNSIYRLKLRELRRSEGEQANSSKSAFIIQEQDLQYLTENIWVSCSILSSWDDMYDLIFVRWNKYEEWSPCNCILLTKDEAIAHLRLEDLAEAYGEVFVNTIRRKHALARIYFSKLPGMSEQLRKRTGSKRLDDSQGVRGKNLLTSRCT